MELFRIYCEFVYYKEVVPLGLNEASSDTSAGR